MKRFALALDLKDDPDLISQYIAHHQKVWPEIIESITSSGIENMQIFNIGNRLFMLIDAKDEFSFERKAEMDVSNEKVAEWESLMDTYQQRLPFVSNDAKWVLMEKIFEL